MFRTSLALISSKIVDDISQKSKLKLTSELSSNVDIFSKEAFNRYHSIIVSNNGIIKKDQKNILVPIGVDPESVDIFLMNILQAFGARRGEVAHKFRVQRTETLTAVETELTTIVKNIIAYDQAVCDALKLRMK